MLTKQVREVYGASAGTKSGPLFEAHDCSQPTSVIQYALPRAGCSEASEGKMESYTKENLMVLQVQTAYSVKGWACALRRSESDFYCGLWSHSARLLPDRVYRKTQMSLEACNLAVTKQFYVDESGTAHRIQAPGTSYFSLVVKGELSYSHAGGVECKGTQVKIGHHVLDGAVVLLDLELTISALDAEVRFEDRSVVVMTTGEELPPSASFQWITEQGTVILQPSDKEPCHLVVLKVLTVLEWPAGEKGQVTLLNQEERVLLRPGEPVTVGEECEEGVYQGTNYKDIIIRRQVPVNHTSLQFSQDTAQVHLGTFLAEKDSWLDFEVQEMVRRLPAHCEGVDDLVRRLESQAPAQPGMAVHTLLLGESLIVFHCPVRYAEPEEEAARQDGRCHEHLPVMVDRPKGVREKAYLQPLTRLLTKISPLSPCSGAPPLFQDTQGHWWSLHPGLKKERSPIQAIRKDRLGLFPNATGNPGSGFYTSQALDSWALSLHWGAHKKSVLAAQVLEESEKGVDEVLTSASAGDRLSSWVDAAGQMGSNVLEEAEEIGGQAWESTIALVERFGSWTGLALVVLGTSACVCRSVALGRGRADDRRLGVWSMWKCCSQALCSAWFLGRQLAQQRRAGVQGVENALIEMRMQRQHFHRAEQRIRRGTRALSTSPPEEGGVPGLSGMTGRGSTRSRPSMVGLAAQMFLGRGRGAAMVGQLAADQHSVVRFQPGGGALSINNSRTGSQQEGSQNGGATSTLV